MSMFVSRVSTSLCVQYAGDKRTLGNCLLFNMSASGALSGAQGQAPGTARLPYQYPYPLKGLFELCYYESCILRWISCVTVRIMYVRQRFFGPRSA